MRIKYFVALSFLIIMLISFASPMEGTPMGVEELYSKAIAEQHWHYIISLILIIIVSISAHPWNRYKTIPTYNKIEELYSNSILSHSLLLILFGMLWDDSNGNMLFSYCGVATCVLIAIKFPSQKRIDRMMEKAIERNNLLPDNPNGIERIFERIEEFEKCNKYPEKPDDRCTIELTSCHKNKLIIIFAIKKVARLKLTEAIRICYNTPAIIKETTMGEAYNIRKAIEINGGTVKIYR